MRFLITSFLLAACAAAQGQPPARAADTDTLVVNENGYFRIHYEFGLMRISAEALKADGEQLLGDDGLKRLARQTRQHLRGRGIDWVKADWRDRAVVHFRRTLELSGVDEYLNEVFQNLQMTGLL